jgi:hypothetical protein
MSVLRRFLIAAELGLLPMPVEGGGQCDRGFGRFGLEVVNRAGRHSEVSGLRALLAVQFRAFQMKVLRPTGQDLWLANARGNQARLDGWKSSNPRPPRIRALALLALGIPAAQQDVGISRINPVWQPAPGMPLNCFD